MSRPFSPILSLPSNSRDIAEPAQPPSKIPALSATGPVKRIFGQLHLPVFVWPR
jgi:hypothetical protein